MQKGLERKPLLFAAALLALVFVVIDFARPALPVDETRYLTVAWEFLARGEHILPTLNFLPYHHKPPMLFWLIGAMWEVFGVHVWAARFVPFAACLGTLALTGLIAKRLFPQLAHIRTLSILLLMGGLPFTIYGPVIAFDWLLTCAVLLGIYALICVQQNGRARYWFLYGLAIGLGVLIKGPVVLLHLLTPAALVMVWKERFITFSVRDWVGGVLVALLAGAAIGLAWATPAAVLGGRDYAQMIFFGQTAGRMVQAFDHARPFWWFIVLLPAYFVPWIFWPRLWSALRGVQGLWAQPSFRFLVCWAVPVFVAFCMISGKQIHYLLPILPAAAVFFAAVLLQTQVDHARVLRVAGRFVLVVAAINIIVHLGASNHLHKYYALDGVADVVRQAQTDGRPIALARIYHGEIGYLVQLQGKMEPFTDPAEARVWIAENPNGIVVTRYKNPDDLKGFTIVFEQPYRSGSSKFAVLEKAQE